jgi:hypothetical protein
VKTGAGETGWCGVRARFEKGTVKEGRRKWRMISTNHAGIGREL